MCYSACPESAAHASKEVLLGVEVHVEQGRLGDGNPMVYRDYGQRVRLAYDPDQVAEDTALGLLHLFLPGTIGATIIHRANA